MHHLSQYFGHKSPNRSWILPKDIFSGNINRLLGKKEKNLNNSKSTFLFKIVRKIQFKGKIAGRGAGRSSTFPSSAAHRSAGNSGRKMQNFNTFRTNFPPKTGLTDVGRLGLQFSSVIRGIEWRIDSPFWDFGITVTCLSRVGVDWLGSWAMLLVLCRDPPPSSGSQRLQPILIFLRLRNTVGGGGHAQHPLLLPQHHHHRPHHLSNQWAALLYASNSVLCNNTNHLTNPTLLPSSIIEASEPKCKQVTVHYHCMFCSLFPSIVYALP